MKPVILGAGLAGLTTALALSPMPVTLISPRLLGAGCSSSWAQGGIAASMGKDDSPAIHAADTLAAGAHLNDKAVVDQTTQDGPRVIERLIERHVVFDRETNGQLRLGLEAAHQRRRIVHARDATGRAVMDALIKSVRATGSIDVIENATAHSLTTDDGISGVTLNQQGEFFTLATREVVLATGGAAALWRDTTNPHENWGSGLALALRAGATLSDLEFVQFHPTAIDIGRDPMPLASEALRGEGATLITDTGERFIDELLPRDVVARAIWQQVEAGRQVFLDGRQTLGTAFEARFPTIYAFCLSAGIDPSTQPIPVRPAAHYHMGGVLTDARGRTDVKGLWACGEVASTGLHGANRLASNSLLEAASFGQRVAEDIIGAPLPRRNNPVSSVQNQKDSGSSSAKIRAAAIRGLMSENVGVTRKFEGLRKTLSALRPFTKESDMALVGSLITLSALKREESRGAHSRVDFPEILPAATRSHVRLTDLEDFSC